MTLKEYIVKLQKQMDYIDMKLEYIDPDRIIYHSYVARRTTICGIIKDLKNLPNELQDVSNNEQKIDFCRNFGCCYNHGDNSCQGTNVINTCPARQT